MIKVFSAYSDNYASSDKAFDSSVDITTNGMSVISPTSAKMKIEDFGGDWYLELTVPTASSDASYLTARNIIVADTPEGSEIFRITDPVYEGNTLTIKAKHIFFDAEDYVIVSRSPVNSSPNAIIGSILDYLKGNTSDSVTHKGLAPNCPFKLASIIGDDNPEETIGKLTKSFNKTSLKDALIDLQDYCRDFDNKIRLYRKGFSIGLTRAQNQTNIILNYGDGLTKSKVEYDFSDSYTRIIPIGTDETPLENWYLDYDPSKITLSPKYFKMKIVNFDQEYLKKNSNETDASWKERVRKDLKKIAQFNVNAHAAGFVNYSVSAVPPDGTKFKLGDVVTVNDSRLNLHLENVPVVGYEYNLLTKNYESIEFGTIKKKLSRLRR